MMDQDKQNRPAHPTDADLHRMLETLRKTGDLRAVWYAAHGLEQPRAGERVRKEMVTIVKVLEQFNPRAAWGGRQWVAFTEVMLRRGQAVAVVQLDEEEPELLTEDPDHGE